MVQSRYSQRSCDNVVKFFTALFHDTEIAKMTLQKSKCGYVINHGTAYWECLLLQEVTNSPFYVLSFDESLNKHQVKMDITVRYWDGDKVHSRDPIFNFRIFECC